MLPRAYSNAEPVGSSQKMMSSTLKEKVFKGFINISFRQVIGVLIAGVGSIFLARYLGVELLGAYAVSSFFLGLVGVLMEFGIHNFIIRWQGELNEDIEKTAFTIKFILVVIFAFIVVFVLAPFVSAWYENDELYVLILLSFLGTGISSLLKMSQSILEKEMEYTKLSIVEIVGIGAFYLPSAIFAYCGLGIFSLAIGEICRGLSTLMAFLIRPFKAGFLLRRDLAYEIVRFGSSYTTTIFSWMAGTGLNPIVVGKMAGLEAAGIIRIAEGIVGQLTLFKGISDRLSYPTFAELQDDKQKLVQTLESGRTYQIIIGVLPLFFFTALSFWLVPLLYGDRWYAVVNVLPLFCLTIGVNAIFGLYASALITAGKNWEVTTFHIVYAALLWMVAPVCVYYLGYLGLPLATIIAMPAYFVIHRYFILNFGWASYRKIFIFLLASWTVTLVAWSLNDPLAAFSTFLLGHAVILALHKSVRENLFQFMVVRPKSSQA